MTAAFAMEAPIRKQLRDPGDGMVHGQVTVAAHVRGSQGANAIGLVPCGGYLRCYLKLSDNEPRRGTAVTIIIRTDSLWQFVLHSEGKDGLLEAARAKNGVPLGRLAKGYQPLGTRSVRIRFHTLFRYCEPARQLIMAVTRAEG
jgi:hypothetical protein